MTQSYRKLSKQDFFVFRLAMLVPGPCGFHHPFDDLRFSQLESDIAQIGGAAHGETCMLLCPVGP